MPGSQGSGLLSVFDTTEADHGYLADLIDSGIAPSDEVRQVQYESLNTSIDNWQSLIQCARVLRDREQPDPTSLEPQDVLSYIPRVLEAAHQDPAWARTDRMIAVAKEVAEKAQAELSALESSNEGGPPSDEVSPVSSQRPSQLGHASHYWGSSTGTDVRGPAASLYARHSSRVTSRVIQNAPTRGHTAASQSLQSTFGVPAGHQETVPGLRTSLKPASEIWLPLATQAGTSPYFHKPKTPGLGKSPRRPAPGIVSSVPFPPLDAPSFGLIQERLAHEPFWLLVAVTFLIKTRGTVAIPVFEQVRLRFPSPAHIADPANAEAILNMIRPLGLAKNRLLFLQKYANGFLTTPPIAERRYRVPGYDHRDTDSPREEMEIGATLESGMLTPTRDREDDVDAWEIGHLSKGKYALDSWRIFCRDELLGRATDWNGRGREGEFQPEWMRVRPNDKELRACLRWLWMREGWEWNPRTSERTVLREELRTAVNERRVEYDDVGELRILDEAR